MANGKWARRFEARGIGPTAEERRESDAAVLARIEAEQNPTCPICGDDRDERLPYCSAECCAEDEDTDLSPTGFAGDRRIPCGSCGKRGAALPGAKRVARYCDEGCAALASDLDCTSATPSREALDHARAKRAARVEVANARRALEVTFSMPDFANALLRGCGR